jgi:hypothetical protein
MFKCFVFLLGVVFLAGCSSKEEHDLTALYTAKMKQGKALQKTEKIQFYEDEVTQMSLVATYLYVPKITTTNDDEIFVVGVHAEDDSLATLSSKKEQLTLNDEAPKEIKLLQKGDERIQKVSFLNPWNRYYLVTFAHIKSKKLTLSYTHQKYGTGVLYFAKVAKYVLE